MLSQLIAARYREATRFAQPSDEL